MREKYLRFTALLGLTYSKIFGNIWWYSLVHEKNTSISKAYHHLCKGIVEKERFLLLKCFILAIKKYFTFIYRYFYFWKKDIKVESEILVGYTNLIDSLKTDSNTIIYIPQRKDYKLIGNKLVIDNFLNWTDFIFIPFKYIVIALIFLFCHYHKKLFITIALIVGLSRQAYDVDKSDLYHSFMGEVLVEGLFFERAFKNLAKRNIKKIIYVYEGRAWEKALCIAFPYTKKIGVMCSLPCLNTLQMFYDIIDIYNGMPKPDYLGVMGRKSKEIMDEVYGKDKVFILGTTRHGYLENVEQSKKEKIIGIIFSSNDDMNKELYDYIFENYDKYVLQIRIALHPDCNSTQDSCLYIVDDLKSILEKAFVIIVTNSSVAMEAMAYGIPSIIPELKSYVSMIPEGIVICKDISEAEIIEVDRNIIKNNFTFITKERMREIINAI